MNNWHFFNQAVRLKKMNMCSTTSKKPEFILAEKYFLKLNYEELK